MQSITLQTSDSSVVVNDILGRLGFAASSESDGGDSVLTAAVIKAVAEETFNITSNGTSIVFATASSSSATDKLKITSDGHFVPVSGQSCNIGSSTYPFANVYSNAFIKSGGTSSQFLKADGSVDGSTYAKSAGIGYYAAWFQGTGGGNDITYYGSDTKDNIYVSTDMYFQSKYGMRFLTDAPAFIGSATERLHLDTSEAVFNDGGNNYDFRVEGDTDSDLLLVDANLDIVQIGKLNINGAFTFPTVDGSAGQSLVTDGAGTVSWSGVSGGGGTDTNDYVDSISFNTSDGVLTLGRTGALSDLTVDLDGRYSTTDNDTTYTDGSGLSLVGTTFHANVDSVTQSVAPNSVSSTASRTYAVQVDSNDKLVVNVPWVDTDTNISLSGNLVGDLNLNNYDIVGTGNITIDGNVTAEYFYGDLDGVVITECRNGTATTISEGTPVYVSGHYSSNGKPLIAEANASSSSTMPAIGLLASDLASGAEGHVHVFGLAKNLPSAVTNGFSVGETVYVAAGGGLTNVRPTGVSELVQNIGRVLKTGTNGRILVLGPGRSNDVPNSGHFEQLTVDEASNFLSTIYAPNIGAGEDNSVVVLDSDGKLRTDEIDSRVWGSSLVDGNGTASYLPKWSDTDTLTNSVIYDDGTNVGIGTASPQAKLDVSGVALFGTSAGSNTVYYDAGQGLDLVKSTDSTDGLHFGDKAYSTSSAYQGIKHLGMTGSSDYMMISEGLHTLISAKATTGSVYIRGGGNYSANQIRVYPSTMPNGASIEIDGTNTSEIVVNQLGNNVDFRVEGDSDTHLLFSDASSDRVGIGTSAPNGKLGVYQTTTNQSYQYGIYNSANHYTTSNATNYVLGNYTDIRKHVASGVTDTGYVMGTDFIAVLSDEGSLSSSFGLRTYAGINNQSDNGTLTTAYGIQSRVINYGQGTANINTAHGVNVYIQGDLGNVGNGEITNAYGLYVNPLYNVTTYAYGLYVAAMDSGTTNKYGIYQNGSNDTNVFMGDVGIGTNTPSATLDIVGDLEVSETITASGCPVVISNTGIATGSDIINNIVSLTEAEYNAATIDDQTVYIVTDSVSDGILSTVNGRLTLESGQPVSTTDQSAKTTLYFTPYKGNQVSVYNGTNWSVKTLSEISLSLSGYAADTNFDIFVYDNSGTLTLESVAWTDDTTRATALTTQDGVYVKSGATTRRYLGTIRTTATTGQCEDSEDRRFVWNYYNQTHRQMTAKLGSGTSGHTYTTTAWRSYSNSTTVGTSRNEFIIGLDQLTRTDIMASFKFGYVSFNYDSTSASLETDISAHDGDTTFLSSHSYFGSKILADGYHYVQALEFGAASSSSFFHYMKMETNILC